MTWVHLVHISSIFTVLLMVSSTKTIIHAYTLVKSHIYPILLLSTVFPAKFSELPCFDLTLTMGIFQP